MGESIRAGGPSVLKRIFCGLNNIVHFHNEFDAPGNAGAVMLLNMRRKKFTGVLHKWVFALVQRIELGNDVDLATGVQIDGSAVILRYVALSLPRVLDPMMPKIILP